MNVSRWVATMVLCALPAVGCTSPVQDSEDEDVGQASADLVPVSLKPKVTGDYLVIRNPGTNYCLQSLRVGPAPVPEPAPPGVVTGVEPNLITQAPCNGSANQQFWLEPATGKLHSSSQDECMGYAGGFGLAGISCINAEKYRMVTDSKGVTKLQWLPAAASTTSRCLSWTGRTGDTMRVDSFPNSTNCTPVVPNGATESPLVQTEMILGTWPVSYSATTLVTLRTRCIGPYNYSTANGAPVVGWDCGGPSGNSNMQWTLNGAEIRGWGNKCLSELPGGPNGAAVYMWDCVGDISQHWTVTTDGQIKNQQSGRCLELKDYNMANGAYLQMWNCYYGANQVWRNNL